MTVLWVGFVETTAPWRDLLSAVYFGIVDIIIDLFINL
jgi:hypothetical protein